MNLWWTLLIAWGVLSAVMTLLWLVQRRRGDAGIVDVAWGLGVGAIAVVGALSLTDGYPPRRALVATMAALWALRLSGHILLRLLRQPEDGRYQALRKEWGPRAQRNLWLFFQVQAVWSVLFALPMLLAMHNPQPRLGWLDALGLAVFVLAAVGETIADRQLARFRNNPANRGRVCRDGLWYYSRHPNYFFEAVHWWAYVPIASGAPYGWLAVLGPLLMLVFLLKVTGIPPTEAQALRTRGDAYREYQRTTSVLIPWPPRRSESP